MSIRDAILQRVSEKRLYEVRPPFLGDSHSRSLFVSREIWSLLTGPWRDLEMEKRCKTLLAELESFASGHRISVCMTPKKAKHAYLAILDKTKDGVWDIRSRVKPPAIRLIGQFAMKDVFVALIPAARSVPVPWLTRGPLHDADSPEWEAVIRECIQEYKSLLRPHVPVRGDEINDYLSAEFDRI